MKLIERPLQGVLGGIISQRIMSRNLEDRLSRHIQTEEERADLPISDAKGKILLFIELKDPRASDGNTIYNYKVVGREMNRARGMRVTFFGICNFIDANLFDVEFKNRDDVFQEPILTHEELDRLRIKFVIVRSIEQKLIRLADWYIDLALGIQAGIVKPQRSIDELFIFKLKNLIAGYNIDIGREAWDQFENKKSFKKELQTYAKHQQWSSTIITTQEEVENFTYLSLLLLVSKLVFYKALVDFKEWNLPKMVIPETISKRSDMESLLWDEYFNQAIESTGDFKLLIGSRPEFIQKLPFVSDAVVDLVNAVIDAESHYDFSKISYDIVGRIFEELIRDDERHKRGQYFTPSRVVDLINAFCIRTGEESVLDPSCGSGTFLVRAYERKKKLSGQRHPALVEKIHGVDISPYAAHLSMLNIAMRDLRYKAFPNIECRDFFKEGRKISSSISDKFDVVVGNPPYTQQEEIDDFTEGSKRAIQTLVYKDWRMHPSAKTSLYGYFFYAAAAKLREGGCLGFLSANSWMDTEFGEDLQKWMLDHFEIEAIIDTKCERFFPSASVNTNIAILRRQSDASKRLKNKVRLVYFKEKIDALYERFGSPDALRDFILGKKADFEDQSLRIRVVTQEILRNEKWTPILKAPPVFFDILKRGDDKWQELGNDIANIRRGVTTGVNKFFQVKDHTGSLTSGILHSIRNNVEKLSTVEEIKRAGLRVVESGDHEIWLIEKEHLRPIVKSPKEVTTYLIDPTKLRFNLIMAAKGPSTIREQSPFLYRYIKAGEKKGFNEVESAKNRTYWYDLGEWESVDALWFASYNERFVVPKSNKMLEDKRLYGIDFNNKSETDFILGVLNSTIFPLLYEIGSRSNLGDGATEWAVYEVKTYRIPYRGVTSEGKKKIATAFRELSKNKVQSIFAELNAGVPESVTLKRVSASRLELDAAVLEAIGFTTKRERDKIQLALYQAVIDLVRSRIDKAQSVSNTRTGKRRVAVTLYISELRERIKDEEIAIERTPDFLRALVQVAREISEDKKLHAAIVRTFWKEEFEENVDKKQLERDLQTDLFE